MPGVTVFIRVRPDVARTNNTPAGVKERFTDALSGRAGVENFSFPAPRRIPGSQSNLGHEDLDEGERPMEVGVVKDGPAVDVRFDWTDVEADAFLHSREYLGVIGPLTRAPFIQVLPR